MTKGEEKRNLKSSLKCSEPIMIFSVNALKLSYCKWSPSTTRLLNHLNSKSQNEIWAKIDYFRTQFLTTAIRLWL